MNDEKIKKPIIGFEYFDDFKQEIISLELRFLMSDKFNKLYEESINNPENFWREASNSVLIFFGKFLVGFWEVLGKFLAGCWSAFFVLLGAE